MRPLIRDGLFVVATAAVILLVFGGAYLILGEQDDPVAVAAKSYEARFGEQPVACEPVVYLGDTTNVIYCHSAKWMGGRPLYRGCFDADTGEDVSLRWKICNPRVRGEGTSTSTVPRSRPKPKKVLAPSGPAAQGYVATFGERPYRCESGYETITLNSQSYDVSYCYSKRRFKSERFPNGRPFNTGCYVTATGQAVTQALRNIRNSTDIC